MDPVLLFQSIPEVSMDIYRGAKENMEADLMGNCIKFFIFVQEFLILSQTLS